jgi:uncharacterized membrane protein
MWQIMWLLSLLPDWVYHLITIAGVLGLIAAWVLKFIPFVSTYRLPIQVGSIIAVLFGIWMEGGIVNEAKWQARVKELEEKVAVAEAQSKETNTKIVTKVITKTQIVRTRGQDIVKYVDREIVKYDTKFAPGGVCEIPQEFIKAHNDSAEAPK